MMTTCINNLYDNLYKQHLQPIRFQVWQVVQDVTRRIRVSLQTSSDDDTQFEDILRLISKKI